MKKIKFIFILLFSVLPVLVLASCGNKLAFEAINRISTTQDKKENVTDDFVVNAKIVYEGVEFTVSWESDNAVAVIGTELVDKEGKADPNGAFYLVDIKYADNTEADQKVTLTAHIEKASKSISFIVPKAVGVPKENLDLSKYTLTSIPEAIEIAKAAGETATKERYIIYGTVKNVSGPDYGAMTITDGTNELYIYGMYNADGTIKYKELGFKPVAGDEIVISANLCTYNGEAEVHAAWLLEFKQAPKVEIELPAAGTEISIATAIQIAKQNPGDATKDRWIIKGTVKTVTNPQYGEMYITDGKDEILVYGTYDAKGEKRYSEMTEKPVAGDSIVLSVNLNEHNGTPQVKAGWIQSFEHNKPNINPEDYTVKTIKEARNAEVGSKVKVSGVVAVITYANGRIPDGAIIVDGESSIYVYGRDVAGQVSVGNTISVYAELDHFIADNEKTHANTHGYMGAIQLTNSYIAEIDKQVSEINLDWTEEMTVKEVVDSSFGNPITSLIVKSTAIIVKDEQKGYTNYYIKDLDNKTGSYIYTKCNGGDFSWLDEFDGKICTVYFTVLNAKSQDTGCIWRLQPVKVEKIENYQFAAIDAPKFALDYNVVDLFKDTYTVDPAIKVPTLINIETVGIEGITLTYSSIDEEVVYFTVENDTTVMHTGSKVGKTEITVLATYQTFTATYKKVITVGEPVKYDALTVKQAIDAAKDTEVIVKGIVTSGQQNKAAAFYLTDETGLIAVEFASVTSMEEIEIGQEIIIKGTRTVNVNKGNDTYQQVVNNAILLSNNFGEHEIPTTSYKTITAEQLVALAQDKTVSSTAQGYIVTGLVSALVDPNYTNHYFGYGDTKGTNLQFYTGNYKQINWLLDEFIGQEVTLEVAFCDWNNKSVYRLVLLAIHTPNGKIVNTYGFQ